MNPVLARARRAQIDQFEFARLDLIEAKIRNGTWKDHKSSFFPAKPMERYLFVLVVYGQLGLTPQELYSVRKIWLQAPDETFNLSVKTLWANLHKLAQDGLAEDVNEGLTYRYFAKQEKFLDFSFPLLLMLSRSKLQPYQV
jgi:hypothetical protein